jgi:putative transposase
MNAPRCTPEGYIQFLLATPRACSATEAARVQPDQPDAPAHDAFTRLLHRIEPDPQTLWDEVRPRVEATGVLVLDDTVLDKPHAKHMGLVAPFWSGRHKRVVRGINLVTPVWTDGDRVYPTDYRLVDPAARPKRSKNDLFAELVREAHTRGFRPSCVTFDSWYSGKDNLKADEPRPAVAHRLCDPRVRAPGVASVHHRDQLDRGQTPHHPRRRPSPPRTAHDYS